LTSSAVPAVAAAQLGHDPRCRACGRPVPGGVRGSAAAGQVQV